MRCDQFEQRMQALLDRRAVPQRDALLMRHAANCPCCAQLMVVESEVGEFLADTSDAVLDDAFTSAVMAELAPATKSTRPHFAPRSSAVWRAGRLAASIGAVAATLLLCLIPLLVQDDPPSGDPSQPPRVAVTEPSANVTGASAVRLSEGQATRKLMTFASQKLDGADDVAVAVAGDLQPWARSIGSALAALRQAWPVKHGARREQPTDRDNQ